MKRAIVTGATGFVGRWLVWELLRQDIPVAAVVRPDSGRRSVLPVDERLEIVPCAMEEYEKLPERMRVQEGSVFFHLAWEGVYGPKRVDLGTQLQCIAASKAAVAAAAALGCTKFVGLGSIMEKESVAVAEADGAAPGMPYIYGEAKHMAHLVTKAAASQLGIAHLWPILTNPYGEYDDSTRFINATLKRILHNEPLEFSSGTQRYDFIHIEDAVKAMIAVAERGKPFHSYMLGSGKAARPLQALEIFGYTGEAKFAVSEDKEYLQNNPNRRCPVIDKARKLLGYDPQVDVEQGVRYFLEYIKESKEDELVW